MTKPGKTRKTDKNTKSNRKNKSKNRINMKGGNRTQGPRARKKAKNQEFHAKMIDNSRASYNKLSTNNGPPTQPLLGPDNSKHPHPKAPVITTLVGGVAAVGVLALVYISSNK